MRAPRFDRLARCKMMRERMAGGWKPASWLLEQLAPLATRALADLKPIDLLATLKRIEAKGKHETARRCRSFASPVFRYGVATGRAETDPTSVLRGALITPKVQHCGFRRCRSAIPV